MEYKCSTKNWRELEHQFIDDAYHLIEFLGSGAYAGVFKANHVIEDNLVNEVAVKLISQEASSHIREPMEEAAVWTNLEHQSIVSFYDVGTCRIHEIEYIYLVTELGEESLDRRIARGPIPKSVVTAVAWDLLTALNYLHSQYPPIVHRDVKPANILKVGKCWKLNDFGTAKQVSASSMSSEAALGTPAYAPPEVLKHIESTAWDIWSLGVVIYEALTGSLPFTGSSFKEISESARSGEKPRIDAKYRELVNIVHNCLDVDHDNRLTAKEALRILSNKITTSNRLRVPADFPTLQQALANATAGQEILIDPGTWNESIVIDTPLTLKGAKKDNPPLICTSGSDTLVIRSDKVSLKNLVVQSKKGYAIITENGSDAKLDSVHISDCRGYGLLARSKSKVNVVSSRFSYCQQSGCRVEKDAQVSVTDTFFERSNKGCGALVKGRFSAKGCSFFGNANAGIWVAENALASVDNCDFTENTFADIYADSGAQVNIKGPSLPDKIKKADGANVVLKDR